MAISPRRISSFLPHRSTHHCFHSDCAPSKSLSPETAQNTKSSPLSRDAAHCEQEGALLWWVRCKSSYTPDSRYQDYTCDNLLSSLSRRNHPIETRHFEWATASRAPYRSGSSRALWTSAVPIHSLLRNVWNVRRDGPASHGPRGPSFYSRSPEKRQVWGPLQRLLVREVVESFVSRFLVEQIEYRPRSVRPTCRLKRPGRPLTNYSLYSKKRALGTGWGL
jgi:hypothetical protein